jgi:hypothetical protein
MSEVTGARQSPPLNSLPMIPSPNSAALRCAVIRQARSYIVVMPAHEGCIALPHERTRGLYRPTKVGGERMNCHLAPSCTVDSAARSARRGMGLSGRGCYWCRIYGVCHRHSREREVFLTTRQGEGSSLLLRQCAGFVSSSNNEYTQAGADRVPDRRQSTGASHESRTRLRDARHCIAGSRPGLLERDFARRLALHTKPARACPPRRGSSLAGCRPIHPTADRAELPARADACAARHAGGALGEPSAHRSLFRWAR